MSKRRNKQKLCPSKEVYLTVGEAEGAAYRAMMRNEAGLAFAPYPCRICGCWHVGHSVVVP